MYPVTSDSSDKHTSSEDKPILPSNKTFNFDSYINPEEQLTQEFKNLNKVITFSKNNDFQKELSKKILLTLEALETNEPSKALLEALQEITAAEKSYYKGDAPNLNWDLMIDIAIKSSPGAKKDELAQYDPKAYIKAQEEEWLVKDPLTGICFGLAIELIVKMTLQQSDKVTMQPSDHARYYEKLMIIVADAIMTEFSVDYDDLLTHRFADVFYRKTLALVEKECNIKGKIFPSSRQAFKWLPSQLRQINPKGHSILILENPGKKVLANHAIYFNRDKGLIHDGSDGTWFKVPADDFDSFFLYYINKRYKDQFKDFVIANVESVGTPKLPGFLDLALQKVNLTAIGVKGSFKSAVDFFKAL